MKKIFLILILLISTFGLSQNNPSRFKNGIGLAPKTVEPSSPKEGDIYYNDTLNKFLYYDGTTWVEFAGGSTPDFPNYADVYGDNAIIEGGIIHVSGLTYTVWVKKFIINGSKYDEYVTQDITLNNGDLTLNRFDVFYVEKLDDVTPATLGVLEGELDADPVKPLINYLYQTEISFKLLQATETTDPNVVTSMVYDEGTEWAIINADAGIDTTIVSTAYKNTKSILIPNSQPGSLIFKNDTHITYDANGYFILAIKLNEVYPRGGTVGGATPTASIIKIKINGTPLLTASTLYVGNAILEAGGLDVNNITTWQLVQIPQYLFNYGNLSNVTNQFDTVRFEFSNTPSMYIDFIQFQGGINNPQSVTSVVEEQTNPIEPYHGNRISPINSISGYVTKSNINGSTGYFTENINTGNGAYSGFIAKGIGLDNYENVTSLQHMGSGYQYPYLQNKGLIYSTNDLFFMSSKNTGKISFRLGNTASTSLSETDTDDVFSLNPDRTVLFPNLTNALIASGGGKSPITLDYFNANSPATITATNGLTKTLNNISLGGSLSEPTTITANGTNSLTIDGSLLDNNYRALTINGGGNVPLTTVTTNTGIANNFGYNGSDNASVLPLLTLFRYTTQTTSTNGIGGALDFYLEGSDGFGAESIFRSTRLISTAENTAFGSLRSGFKIQTLTGGGYIFPLAINENGYLNFSEYGNGTITGTPTYGAAFDINGNLIETALGGGGISNIIEDTSPQLGFNLDVNGFAIYNGGNEYLSFDPFNILNVKAANGLLTRYVRIQDAMTGFIGTIWANNSFGSDQQYLLPGLSGTFALEANASGFNGNLTTTDNTLQEIAQKFDDYVGGGGSISDAVYDGTWNADTTNGASKNVLFDKIEGLILGNGTTATPQVRTTVGGETTWVVSGGDIPSSHQLFANGLKLQNLVDYTYTGNTFTFEASYLPIAVETQSYYPNVAALGTGAISDKTTKVTLDGTEEVLIEDVGGLKKTTTQAIADLGGGGGSTQPFIKALWKMGAGINRYYYNKSLSYETNSSFYTTSVTNVPAFNIGGTAGLGIPIISDKTITSIKGNIIAEVPSSTFIHFVKKHQEYIITDLSITAAGTTLTSSTFVFEVGDVGKTIRVVGAGASGAVLSTTIASYTSPSSVELTLAASTTVASANGALETNTLLYSTPSIIFKAFAPTEINITGISFDLVKGDRLIISNQDAGAIKEIELAIELYE